VWVSSHDVALTVDGLARESGVSVRNIRYYQELGLIHHPERRGRMAYYGAPHLTRLQRITALREEGLSLDAISRLLSSADSGQLRFMQTLLDDAANEAPTYLGVDQLGATLTGGLEPAVIARALDTSFFSELPDGEIEVRSPALLRIGSELAQLSIPLDDAVDLLASLEEHLGAIAENYVRLFLDRVWHPATRDTEEVRWAELEQTLVRLRALAGESVAVAFTLLMRESTERAREREMRGREVDAGVG
jgi:DNA-binding transcriptional MerR regulator